MKPSQSEASSSPNVHRENIKRELSQLIEHLEADMHRVEDQRFRGLLEKSAEVLKGLRSLFERYRPAGEERQGERPVAGRKESGDKPAAQKKTRDGKGGATPRKDEGAAATSGRGKTPATGEQSRGSAKRRQKNASPAPTSPEVANNESATAPPKPEDPDAIAAREELQRKEARAPKLPGGQSAPRPTPPRSGKPVWRTPHS
jgi:hypothetical protein